MVSPTYFYYTTAIDKAFLRSSGSGGVAFASMSSMEDIWKVGATNAPGAIYSFIYLFIY